MKTNSIFIDLRNKEHVDWWLNTASKMVKVVKSEKIVETATGKPVGAIIMIKGMRKNKVVRENLKFIKNPVTAVFKKGS